MNASRTKRTPKQRVLRRLPSAECRRYNGYWGIYSNETAPGLAIGYHRKSRKEAWAMAARCIS